MYTLCNFLPTTGKIIKSHSFHQQRQIFVTKRQQLVLDQVKYSQGFFILSFPALKLPLCLKISSLSILELFAILSLPVHAATERNTAQLEEKE